MRHAFAILLLMSAAPALARDEVRPRARDAGVVVGILQPGPLNAAAQP